MPYEAAGPIIRAILQHAQTIYVKGSEKINWLSNFLGTSLRLVNLETLDCPALEKIDDTSSAECFHHWNVMTCDSKNVKKSEKMVASHCKRIMFGNFFLYYMKFFYFRFI